LFDSTQQAWFDNRALLSLLNIPIRGRYTTQAGAILLRLEKEKQ